MMVEVLPGARRSVRRAVALEAQVIAGSWEAPRLHRVLDLTPDGVRLAAASLLPVGEHVVVCFTPPGWWLHGELTVFARVVRTERRRSATPATIALELCDLPRGARGELARTLRGVPPPVPSRPGAGTWIDVAV